MGVLDGVKVLELGGIGPGPFCGMLLADMGADVVIIDRRNPEDVNPPQDLLNRNKRSVHLNLKDPVARDVFLEMATKADMVIDPFRPGVVERLGIGPESCHERNPALVFGRMTGWGQTGPLSQAAGHDLNYIALTGALDCIGTQDRPIPPINLVGDYGGGSLYLLSGLLGAYIHSLKTGEGQVIDVAICDGVTSLMTGTYSYWNQGDWKTGRGTNFLDGSAPYYTTYRCADDRFISLTPIEGPFLRELLDRIGLSEIDVPSRDDERALQALGTRLATIFSTRTRSEWCAILEGTDACFAPVVSVDEAPSHHHMSERETFIRRDGITQPAPAPRFEKTPSVVSACAPKPGEHTELCLHEWGLESEVIDRFRASQISDG